MVGRVAVIAILTLALLLGMSAAVWRVYQQKVAANERVRNLKRSDISVTIVEGKRREEIAAQLAAAGVTSYTSFLKASEGKEGQLFPDTYRFFPNTDAFEVVAALTVNHQTKAGDLGATADQLTLASIIEREAINDAERPIIAGVYQNRINRGMTLDADPTVQYGKDSNAYVRFPEPPSFSFWGTITRADYRGVISPYNTYLYPGLPPTPICNPGRKSIQAAITPTKHDYLFFAHRNGELLLSKTLLEHERKIFNAR
jgi:UPF0755 protein